MCVHADALHGSGYKCNGTISDAMRVCEISGCTDNELVAAYQKIVESCNTEVGQHTFRAGQRSTHGCNADQLDTAFDLLQTGQCPLEDEQ